MCGINGFVAKRGMTTPPGTLQKMNEVIFHRGPDGEGLYNHQDEVLLGMRRLAIIDLAGGNQPIYTDDRSMAIVFNGEIYNYRELRKQLQEGGATFHTHSDTEVVLKGYERYGADFLQQLNGMFGFAIHDLRRNKVFIARDRMGEKPLYYFAAGGHFLFASELKSIVSVLPQLGIAKPRLSATALNLFFSLTYIPAPHTIYEGVTKLLPGHYMEVDTQTLAVSTTRFWHIPNEDRSATYAGNFKGAIQALRDLLYDAVEKRMVSDVPLGAFLSGGVDSSIITAIMADLKPGQRVNTFSIGFEDKRFDESERAALVAKHIHADHHPIVLDYEDMKDKLESVILNFDEPFADSSALPTYLVAYHTRKKVTVALTGDGGDEVFGGYNRYYMAGIGHRYRKLVPSFLHRKAIRPLVNSVALKEDDRGNLFKYQKLINGIGASEMEDMTNIMSLGFLPADLSALLLPAHRADVLGSFFQPAYQQAGNLQSLHRARFLDKNIALEGDMLVKVDRTSMLTSLECRPPLLDHRLMELSYQLPQNFLIRNGSKKYILKETFRHLLPEGLFELPKSGFGVPVGNWLRQHLRQELLQLSQPELLERQGLFQPAYIRQLVDDHLQSRRDQTFKVWSFYCFQKWWLHNEA